MGSPENSDEFTVNNQTWNKLHDTATKSGFRDGISDGRDSNFQNSFDEGYQLGFKNGFALGLHKGALSSINQNLDEALQKVSRGNCIICMDKSIEEKPIPELVVLQTEKTNNLLKHLQKNQSQTLVSLPEKLN